MGFERILNRLAEQELILPFFEIGMLADNWPESYAIKIDSSPYYGRGDGMFHPSTHPLMGARELYYRFHPDTRDKIIPQRHTVQRQMTLAMGSALHGVVQTQMEMTRLVRKKKVEVEYTIPTHNVRGRIDFIVDHPNGQEIIVEMKTMNIHSFKTQETIKPEWDAQLSLAEYALGHEGGVLLLVEAGWPYQMREFRHSRNDVLLEQIFEKFDLVRQAIKDNTPPRHCCIADSKEMDKCAAKFECWLKDG